MVDTHTSSAGAERAFVLGIDGVPWDLIRKWIEVGELPHFETLFEDGAVGPLESTVPPMTPTAWPSIATGVWPDKHGIYGFQRLESDHTQRMNTSEDLRQPPLWQQLSPAVVGNVPMTYPAGDVDGRMVAGMVSPQMAEGFTHPPEFADEIREEIPDYKIGLNWYDYHGNETAFKSDLASLVAARRKLMNRLMDIEDWQLFFFVYTAPDRLQHLIWDEKVILEHYKQLDDILGDVIEYVSGRNANLFVVSDHGFGPVSTLVHLNAVLANGGYLARKRQDGTRSSLARLGITKSNVLETLKRFGVDNGRFVNSLPKPLVDRIAERVPGDHGLYDVDFSETVAFAHGPSYIYVNDSNRFGHGIVPPEDVPELKRELASLFSDLTDPETGEEVVTVSDGDDLFPTDTASPDLVVVGNDGYEEKTNVTDSVFSAAETEMAGHRSRGVFFAWGPNVKDCDPVADLSVVDVAPTVLHSIGEPIPENVDGAVQNELLETSRDLAVRSVEVRQNANETTDTQRDDDFDGVEERLRGLGYME
ncbi:alkaline phosphatase family protein [Natribaculum luteum]|uniref:Alkaline phosphatase family protein n=1 Tax=Natribaculum luteum TaxID=1586232 RepID=A0ABD5P0W2_9EURY|nr:alkaline phosphatase family protein [Natribaculum luteum]